MFALALSCLQGRPMVMAAQELVALGVGGLQLTPGNAPSVGAKEQLAELGVELFTHHGFSWEAMRAPVWSGASCLVSSDSVHAPRTDESDGASSEAWQRHFANGAFLHRTLETMYPGYQLGTGVELDRAMDLGQPLAVDVSHLHIQRTADVLSDRTLSRLLNYDHIAEVHLSANDGKRDGHRPIDHETFGLDWAKERLADGALVVLECYMHKLSSPQRRHQLAIAGLDC